MEKLVPDTSVIIEGVVSEKIEKNEIKADEIIIHEAAFAELEHQANMGRATGFIGLDEIKKIKELAEKNNFKISFTGNRPTSHEIKYSRSGEIDAVIRQMAWEQGATLITGDKVQAKVAEAKGIPVIIVFSEKKGPLSLEKYFDKATMSVHLREDLAPYAKKGAPGKWDFVELDKKKMTQKQIKEISKEIIEETRLSKDGFIEIEREGSTIIQLGVYRIVITRPPFSDGWEITAVRPVKTLNLEEYKLSEKLSARIEQAEGMLIAGSPGMGKTTFSQALALFYAGKKKVVKTVEAPRDLQLGPQITQYAIRRGSIEEIHDILLLSRPDYTVYDEMRNTEDFGLFSDMRLAGVGMVGVIHATAAVDAIQRFIGRVELGVIPHIIDTVIFIKNGTVNKVLSLKMVVKVPSGMTEADLARPVVVITDFETGKLEYEIYTYGEETVVVPVTSRAQTPSQALAAKAIENEFRRYSPEAKIEVVSDNKCIAYVPESMISRIIGKQGSNIEQIEKRIGIGIDVRPLGPEKNTGESVEFGTKIGKKNIQLFVDEKYANTNFDIFVGDDYLVTAKAGKKAVIKIKKTNKMANVLVDAVNSGEKIRLVAK
ncbi:Flp pilus assembly complex ATPase component TadA [Candidatus Woesearchaeota archaeon]|nr:Flp pilus assembly complex ATPase component TadA [Candidatus Woesearchaeota archaeon]